MLWHTHDMFQRVTALFLLIIGSPFFLLLYILIKLTTKNSFLFRQKRLGKNRKPFLIYKIQTMIPGAENLQSSYIHLNTADGPVFKIPNDPRYTHIGKILSKTGLDELPQLLNILKGEMAFVGPRPLPVAEAQKIPKKYEKRFSVLPGITSPWVIKGTHKLTFTEWMQLDLEYVKNKSVLTDIFISFQTIILLFKYIFNIK
jgi:lipopolysaccharide/colanic/teichoic acid biosynthesis glycosyltransferase